MADSFPARVSHDVTVAALKLAPPAGAMIFGFTLNEWVAIATLLYLALQSFYLAWRWQRDWRKGRAQP